MITCQDHACQDHACQSRATARISYKAGITAIEVLLCDVHLTPALHGLAGVPLHVEALRPPIPPESAP